MARRAPLTVWVLVASLAVAFVCAGSAASREAARANDLPATGFTTAVFDSGEFAGPDATTAFQHARAIGAGAARLLLVWASVAPTKPLGDQTDPANKAYHWGAVDREVTLALQGQVEPILDVINAPDWASGPRGPNVLQESGNPEPTDLGRFMLAAARRYSGTFGSLPGVHNEPVPLPRVRYWQIWNEPNSNQYINPQFDSNGEPVSPFIYRQVVNAAADSIHSVHPDNLVVAGGLSPFARNGGGKVAMAPMTFMAALLCMNSPARPTPPACREPIRFDVWAHHPYTAGGPMHMAGGDDVSLGDLPRMKAMLDAAVAAGRIQSTNGVRFWVTEFSWDSNPPDKAGVPADLEVPWVAEAMYRMWKSGVSLATWFLVRDWPSHFQSALYFEGSSIAADTKKPAAAAFLFPFVVHVINQKLLVWGRTPWGQPATVRVQAQTDSGWSNIATLTTNANGIFTQRLDTGTTAKYVRAAVVGASPSVVSPPFPTAELQDMPINPFGS